MSRNLRSLQVIKKKGKMEKSSNTKDNERSILDEEIQINKIIKELEDTVTEDQNVIRDSPTKSTGYDEARDEIIAEGLSLGDMSQGCYLEVSTQAIQSHIQFVPKYTVHFKARFDQIQISEIANYITGKLAKDFPDMQGIVLRSGAVESGSVTHHVFGVTMGEEDKIVVISDTLSFNIFKLLLKDDGTELNLSDWEVSETTFSFQEYVQAYSEKLANLYNTATFQSHIQTSMLSLNPSSFSSIINFGALSQELNPKVDYDVIISLMTTSHGVMVTPLCLSVVQGFHISLLPIINPSVEFPYETVAPPVLKIMDQNYNVTVTRYEPTMIALCDWNNGQFLVHDQIQSHTSRYRSNKFAVLDQQTITAITDYLKLSIKNRITITNLRINLNEVKLPIAQSHDIKWNLVTAGANIGVGAVFLMIKSCSDQPIKIGNYKLDNISIPIIDSLRGYAANFKNSSYLATGLEVGTGYPVLIGEMQRLVGKSYFECLSDIATRIQPENCLESESEVNFTLSHTKVLPKILEKVDRKVPFSFEQITRMLFFRSAGWLHQPFISHDWWIERNAYLRVLKASDCWESVKDDSNQCVTISFPKSDLQRTMDRCCRVHQENVHMDCIPCLAAVLYTKGVFRYKVDSNQKFVQSHNWVSSVKNLNYNVFWGTENHKCLGCGSEYGNVIAATFCNKLEKCIKVRGSGDVNGDSQRTVPDNGSRSEPKNNSIKNSRRDQSPTTSTEFEAITVSDGINSNGSSSELKSSNSEGERSTTRGCKPNPTESIKTDTNDPATFNSVPVSDRINSGDTQTETNTAGSQRERDITNDCTPSSTESPKPDGEDTNKYPDDSKPLLHDRPGRRVTFKEPDDWNSIVESELSLEESKLLDKQLRQLESDVFSKLGRCAEKIVSLWNTPSVRDEISTIECELLDMVLIIREHHDVMTGERVERFRKLNTAIFSIFDLLDLTVCNRQLEYFTDKENLKLSKLNLTITQHRIDHMSRKNRKSLNISK